MFKVNNTFLQISSNSYRLATFSDIVFIEFFSKNIKMINKQKIQLKLKNGTSMYYLLDNKSESQSYIILYHNIAKGTIYCTDNYFLIVSFWELEVVGRVVVQHSF